MKYDATNTKKLEIEEEFKEFIATLKNKNIIHHDAYSQIFDFGLELLDDMFEVGKTSD